MKKFRRGATNVLGSVFLSLLLTQSLPAQGPPIPRGLVSGEAARIVIAQKNFSDITAGTTAERLGATSGITIVGNKLLVADSSYLAPPNNNRILIFNDLNSLKQRLPQDELPAADVVAGQPDFTTSAPGTSATVMNQPVGIASDGVRLFVADWGNNRVLIYNRIPETNGAAANIVAGQADFNSSDIGTSAQKMRRPNSVSSDGTRMMVADTLNHRILIYNRIPTQNGASADVVLGQTNFDSRTVLPTASNTLFSPMSATTDGQRLIVTDLGNHRVLIYNTIPTQSGASAAVVVGQPDFTSHSAGNTATSLDSPRYAYSDGTRLLIADSGNNRILIYNQIPTQNGAAADLVLGQNDFLGLTESCAASNFAVPFAVASDGDMLFVSDAFNRRILGFRPGTASIAVGGIVNGASFSTAPQTKACDVSLPQPPLAPGGIASIFGTNLADTTVPARSTPLPAELGGVRVRFNGIAAPLYYVSPTQINVQVPFEVTGYSASVEIEKRIVSGGPVSPPAVVSPAVAVGVANGAPGIFSFDGTGSGAGLVFHADFSPVTAGFPAKAGETLVAFVTGLGTVDQPIATGATAEFGALGSVAVGGVSSAGQTVTITINGMDYSYTTGEGETLDTVVTKLTRLIDENDPNVSATADVVDFKVKLRARVFGDQGTSITYSASTSGGGLTADVEGSNLVPGSLSFAGTPEVDQTITITLAGSATFTYTALPGDTRTTVINALAERINADPNVLATADTANGILSLELRDPSQGLQISYAVAVSNTAKLQAAVQGATTVPGAIAISGTVIAGQVVNVTVGGMQYSYRVVPQDNLQSVVSRVAEVVGRDPNVSATADLENLKINLQLKNPDSGLSISFSASVSETPSFTAATANQHLSPGVANATNTVSAIIGKPLPMVPGSILFAGTAEPGQTITVRLLETPFSYATVSGDTLQTVITKLAELISSDPNVSATADLTNLKINLALKDSAKAAKVTFEASLSPKATLIVASQSSQTSGSSAAAVGFAGLVKGFVGLYQVNFTLPSDVQSNPSALLTFKQNLIVFGSVTSTDIFSNEVTVPIGQ